jgi:hypothetical protein
VLRIVSSGKEIEAVKAIKLILTAVVFVTAITIHAQPAHNTTQVQGHLNGDKRLHTISGSIERTTKVINYGKGSSVTTVDIPGTSLLAAAHGEAQVERKQNHLEIEAEFDGLQAATRFGPEYLTYVIWTISPEGWATNLGEVVLDGMKSKFNVTTDLASFGLIVTAEPYFAVSQPSEVVVMENVVRTDSIRNEATDVKYELLPRGSYTLNIADSELKPIVMDSSTPLDLYEARNALWIALWAGADKDAAELFVKAERLLQRAEAFHASRAGAKPVLSAARETVQTAESARVLALKRRSAARVSRHNAAGRSSTIRV